MARHLLPRPSPTPPQVNFYVHHAPTADRSGTAKTGALAMAAIGSPDSRSSRRFGRDATPEAVNSCDSVDNNDYVRRVRLEVPQVCTTRGLARCRIQRLNWPCYDFVPEGRDKRLQLLGSICALHQSRCGKICSSAGPAGPSCVCRRSKSSRSRAYRVSAQRGSARDSLWCPLQSS